MIVCESCLEAIESHEGRQFKKKCEETDTEVVYGNWNEDGEFVKDIFGSKEVVWCEWCEEYHPIEDCWVI